MTRTTLVAGTALVAALAFGAAAWLATRSDPPAGAAAVAGPTVSERALAEAAPRDDADEAAVAADESPVA